MVPCSRLSWGDLIFSPACEVGVAGSILRGTNFERAWNGPKTYMFIVFQPSLSVQEQIWLHDSQGVSLAKFPHVVGVISWFHLKIEF